MILISTLRTYITPKSGLPFGKIKIQDFTTCNRKVGNILKALVSAHFKILQITLSFQIIMAHHKQACHNRTNKNWANSQSQKPYKGVNKVGAILHRNSTNKIPPLSLGWGTTSISPTSKVSNFGSVLFLIGTTTFTRFGRLGLHPHDGISKIQNSYARMHRRESMLFHPIFVF